MSTVWPLPKVTYTPLNMTTETRPVALLTSETAWTNFGNLLNLPLVVQAEPTSNDRDLLDYLADHLPSQTGVIYVLGQGIPLTAGKLVANKNKLPLVVVPTAISSDEIFEPHVTLPAEGLMHRLEVGPASEVIIDWSVIEAAPAYERAAGIVDVVAIVTALLDWRYAAKLNRNTPEQQFSQWGAGVAAGLATQAIKSAKEIGEGKIEALRTLVDLLMMSVQLANQLGHDRHEEGTEHYLAFSMGNQGAKFDHAEVVGPGILFASALHGQDPSALRDALMTSGVRLDQLRFGDVRLAINDLPNFCNNNNLPFGIGHEIDPFSERVTKALEKAGLVDQTPTAWQAAPTIVEPAAPTSDTTPLAPPSMG